MEFGNLWQFRWCGLAVLIKLPEALTSETAAQLISFELTCFGDLPFQVLSHTPRPVRDRITL